MRRQAQVTALCFLKKLTLKIALFLSFHIVRVMAVGIG